MALVSTNAVKVHIHGKSMEVSKDFFPALTAKVTEIMDSAIERSKAGGRKTVMPRDL